MGAIRLFALDRRLQFIARESAQVYFVQRHVRAGMMSQYGSGWTPSVSKGLLELLLAKSASVRGFFLPHHSRSYKGHLKALASMWMQGWLDVSLDPTRFV